MTAHLIDDLTKDDAHSSVVVQQHSFAGCLSKDIMERRSYESQHLSHCMNRRSSSTSDVHQFRVQSRAS